MIWYLLFALHFFLLACLAPQWRQAAVNGNLFARPGRGATLLILLCNALLFYPQLIGYFKLYPVSTPNHFALTLLLWMISLDGVVLTLLGSKRWARSAGLSTIQTTLLTLVTCLFAAIILRQDMAAGSLISWWTPVFILLASAMGYGYWSLLMQLAARINRSTTSGEQ